MAAMAKRDVNVGLQNQNNRVGRHID